MLGFLKKLLKLLISQVDSASFVLPNAINPSNFEGLNTFDSYSDAREINKRRERKIKRKCASSDIWTTKVSMAKKNKNRDEAARKRRTEGEGRKRVKKEAK